MSGRHAAAPLPDHSGRRIALLGLIRLLPPALLLAPRAVEAPAAAPVPVSRPDAAAPAAADHKALS